MSASFVNLAGVLQERPDAARYPGVYVTLEELAALSAARCELDLGPRRRALASLAGGHRSAFRGRGIDFDEVRIYNPGDDVRSIDWRVTARTGRPHTKVFREERERPVYLMVDQRQAMFFGSRTALKSVVAARIAALLAWATRDQGDRLGGMIFNDRYAHKMRPAEGKRGIQDLFRVLVQFNQWLGSERGPEDAGLALHDVMSELVQVVRPGSLVFLVSDLRGCNEDCLQQMRMLRRHSDLIVLGVTDPLERQLPPAGQYGFSDGMNSLRLDTSGKKMRKQYSLRFLEQQNHLRAELSRFGVPLVGINTDDDVALALGKALGFHSRNKGATP